MRRTQLFLAAARAARATLSSSAGTARLAAQQIGPTGTCMPQKAPSQRASVWSFGCAAAALAAAVASGPVLLEKDALEPEALQELAHGLASGSSSDKECAVSMLSSLTLYVDHHDALLAAPGVLESLMIAVADEKLVPQVRNIALVCAADLMKSPRAHEAALASPAFVEQLLAALQAQGSWQEGLDEGQAAQAQAARCVAEMAGNRDMHAALLKTGLAEHVANQAARLVHEFGSVAGSYASAAEVPASMDAQSTREEERFIAAAVFGLAGSGPGAKLLAGHPQTLQGVAYWAGHSRDPILQRWGVGALAHLVAAAPEAQAAVAEAGGLPALLTGLTCSDPQAQCFASAAVGSLASADDARLSGALAQQGLGPALARMLQGDNLREAGVSEGVQRGVRRCALRAVNACAANPQLAAALRAAGVPELVQALAAQGRLGSDELQQLAGSAVQRLGGGTQQVVQGAVRHEARAA